MFPLLLLHSCFVLNLYHSVPMQKGWRESNPPDRWGRFSTNAPNRRQNCSGNVPLSCTQLYSGNRVHVSGNHTTSTTALIQCFLMVPLFDQYLLFSHIDYRNWVLFMDKMIAKMNHSISLWALLKDLQGSTLKAALVFSLQSQHLNLQWGS